MCAYSTCTWHDVCANRGYRGLGRHACTQTVPGITTTPWLTTCQAVVLPPVNSFLPHDESPLHRCRNAGPENPENEGVCPHSQGQGEPGAPPHQKLFAWVAWRVSPFPVPLKHECDRVCPCRMLTASSDSPACMPQPLEQGACCPGRSPGRPSPAQCLLLRTAARGPQSRKGRGLSWPSSPVVPRKRLPHGQPCTLMSSRSAV